MHLDKPWSEVAKIAAACVAEIPTPVTVDVEVFVSWGCGKMQPAPLHGNCMMMASLQILHRRND